MTRWSELSPEAAQTIRSWAPIGLVSSPHLARVIGLSPQALKNWRWRSLGPLPEPSEVYGKPPTPIFYRVSSVLAWLDAAPLAVAWIYERDWLLSVFGGWRFVGADGDTIDVHPPLDKQRTQFAGDLIRARAGAFEPELVKWPEPQPRRRRPSLLPVELGRAGQE
jgi:hypothetical protein